MTIYAETSGSGYLVKRARDGALMAFCPSIDALQMAFPLPWNMPLDLAHQPMGNLWGLAWRAE